MNNLDWNQIKLFLVVAQLGSLSAAARQLELSQPTLSRQIQALERQTGLSLFERNTQGLRLTPQGESLMESALAMQQSAEQFNRRATGRAQELSGTVRISVSEVIAYSTLPRLIADFQRRYPQIQLELVVSNDISSLSKREADLALRMLRPTQPDLVAKHLHDIELGFYASTAYLAEYGRPSELAELTQHRIIGFDLDMAFIEGAARMGFPLKREDFEIRSDNLLTQIALIRAGVGIGITHVPLADADPDLQRLFADAPIPPLELWLVCHGDVQFNSRIRAVMGFFGGWIVNNPHYSL